MLRTSASVVSAVAVAVLVSACNKSSHEKSTDGSSGARIEGAMTNSVVGPPKRLYWDSGKLYVPLAGTASVITANGTYRLELTQFPVGTKWKIDQREGAIANESEETINIGEIAPKLRTVPVATLKQPSVEMAREFTVTLPTGQAYLSTVPLAYVRADIRRLFSTIDKDPVRFAGDTPPTTQPTAQLRSVMMMDRVDMKVVGRAKVLADVDGIAISRRPSKVEATKRCGGYASNGQGAPDIHLQLRATEVLIYRRLTGEVIKTKTFPPDGKCPEFAVLDSSGSNTEDSPVPLNAMESWIRSQITN